MGPPPLTCPLPRARGSPFAAYASQLSRVAMSWAQTRPQYMVPPKERPLALMGRRVPGTMPM